MNDVATVVISASIPAVSAIICQIIIAAVTRKNNAKEAAVKEQAMKDKLDRMEEKLDEHNGYADKISSIEKSIVRIDTILSAKGEVK